MAKKVMGLLPFLFIVLIVSTNTVQGSLCSEALAKIMNCLPFLLAQAPTPTLPCCLAVKEIIQEASTKEIRQELCKCFKAASSQYKVSAERAAKLPEECKVQAPMPIKPDIDCSKIQSMDE